jgi:N-acetylated-alpha-linked acidic dipeptidase
MNKFTALLVAWSIALPAPTDSPIRGFTPEGAVVQRALEEKARAVPDPARLRTYMRHMTAEPHIAGSPASKRVADYALGLFKQWGLDARIEEFEALLPYPTTRLIEMTAPTRYTVKLEETRVAGDRASKSKSHIPTYNSYSASGDVTGPLLYVNYGIPDDYVELKKLGIDPKGKIVIARYGQSWRGTKAKVAQENGAVACIIYSDPKEDGYFLGDVYPKGAYRPPQGVQRGSVLDMPLHTGDPLSPGWASEKGSKRLKREEAEAIMKIPVLPISYSEAQRLLSALQGPVAPTAWRGALPITYHIGPGPATVRMKTDFDWTTKPMHNVIVTIPGTESPDEWIMYGNHHDAWNNGAHDPISGAIAVLETGRSLSELMKSGWRPKRTIKLALWDGEEFGLLGSTEWVEKHRAELQRKLIVYFNSDTNGTGNLTAGGSPSLEPFFAQVMRDVKQPGSEKSVLETRPLREGKPVEFRLNPVGAGSDYVAFIHHAGIPTINAGFGGDVGSGGIYHSIYDSFDWYTRFADKDFTHARALSQLMTTAMLRLSEAAVLPFEFRPVTRAVEEWTKELPKVDLAEFQSAVAALKTSAEKYDALNPKPSRALNETLLRAERALLQERGLAGRPWYKHQLMAPGMYTGYSAKTLPSIRDAKDPQAGVKPLADAIRTYALVIDEAARLASAP